jgi:hypothetical protein
MDNDGHASDNGRKTLPISVVIPSYRRPDMLERALRSVFAQEPAPAEVIVVDDASGDDSATRAARLGARVITHELNQGESETRNTGIRAATYPWVALLDCDDEWLPGHLEALWAGTATDHVLIGTAALTTGNGLADHRVKGWPGRRPRELRGPAEVGLPENRVTTSSVMVRRDAALAAGGFPRGVTRAGDLDLWLRMLEQGSAILMPRVTALYHLHPGQISTEGVAMRDAHQAMLDRYRDRPWCTTAVRRRYEGVAAWDTARAAMARGEPPAPTLLRLARRLASPQRLVGVLQLLLMREEMRRAAARFTPGGGPSVAILPGVGVDARRVPGAVDLRGRTPAGALARLIRRPPAQALVTGRSTALLLRLLGIRPIQPPWLSAMRRLPQD